MTEVNLAERRNGIGGSDIAAIVGESPWKTALDVWLDKTGRAEPTPDTPATKRGRFLEGALLNWYAEETGREVELPGLLVNPKRTWQRANLDGDDPRGEAVLECKSASFRQAYRWGEPGTADVPEEYICQGQYMLQLPQMAERRRIIYPACLGGDFAMYEVPRDDELGAALVEAGERFWVDHVLADKPPAVDGSDSCKNWLARQFPRERGALVKASDEVDKMVNLLKRVRIELSNAEKDKAELENQIKAIIGDAAGLEGDGWRITWKARKPTTKVDYQAIVDHLNVPMDVIATFTRSIPGPRVFLPKWAKE